MSKIERAMTNRTLTTVLVAGSVLLTASVSGQVSITSGGLSYAQNFDNLLRTTTAETWVNNADTLSVNDSPRLIGLQGWYVGSFGTTTTTPQIRAGTGSSTTGSFYSFGSSGAADRALGTMPTDASASASMRVGARFVNDTGDYLAGFTFSYDGEQWRKAQLSAAQNNQYVVAFAIFAPGTGLLDGAAYSTNLAAATFNTPIDGGDNVGAALDGNNDANRVAGLGATVNWIALAPGEELWLRWWDSNSSGADHGLGIDNFSITFLVPEPSSIALLGLGAAFLARFARQRD